LSTAMSFNAALLASVTCKDHKLFTYETCKHRQELHHVHQKQQSLARTHFSCSEVARKAPAAMAYLKTNKPLFS